MPHDPDPNQEQSSGMPSGEGTAPTGTLPQKRKRSLWQRIIIGTAKTVTVFIAAVVLLVTLLLLSLHIPLVQRTLVTKLSSTLTEVLKFPVSVGYVYISWLDTLVMKDVVIKDGHGERLIAVQDLRVRFSLTALAQHNITVRAAYLEKPEVNVIMHPGAKKLNINEFVDNILAATTDPKAPYNPDPVGFVLRHAVLENGRFTFDDRTQPAIPHYFDHLHMVYDNLDATIEDFMVKGKFIGMGIKELSAHEQAHDLKLKNLKGYLSMDSTYLRLDRLHAQLGTRTHIKRMIGFKFKNWDRFPQFNDSVQIEANLDSTYIDFDDLRAFAPDLPKVNEVLRVKARFAGYVSNFSIRNFQAGFGQGSTLAGDVAMRGLPDWDRTFINTTLEQANIQTKDLLPYFPEAAHPSLTKLEYLDMPTTFKGTPTVFKFTTAANTALGKLRTATEMNLNGGMQAGVYKGILQTDGFHLGQLLGIPDQLQLMTVNTSFEGKGFTPETVRLFLQGQAQRIGIRNYTLQNTAINGGLANQVFGGVVSAADPNLSGRLEGKIDLSHKPEVIDVDLALKHANLAVFKILPDVTHLAGIFKADIHSLDPDPMRGYVRATEVEATIKGTAVKLDEMALRKYMANEQQVIEAECDWAMLNLTGNYTLTALAADLGALAEEYVYFFKKNLAQQRTYYTSRKPMHNNYGLNYRLEVIDPKPLLRIYAPDVLLSNDVTLAGSYTSASNAVVIMNTEIDSLGFGTNLFTDLVVDVNSAKSRSSSSVLASAHVQSAKQKLFGMNPMEQLVLDVEWNDQDINFDSEIRQPQTPGSIYKTANELSIGGLLHFFEDRYVVTLDKSSLHLLDEDWTLDAQNQFSVFYGKSIAVNKFSLRNQNQDITASGWLGPNAADTLKLLVQELHLDLLNSVIGKRVGGQAHADISIKAALGTPEIRGNIQVDSLSLEDFVIGNVVGSSTWDNANRWLNLDLDVVRGGEHLIRLDGHYETANRESPLQLQAYVTGLPLKIMEGFLGSIMSNWAGTATGLVDIRGAFDKIILDGNLQVNGGVFKYNYLNTTYRFNDRIKLSRNLVSMDNTELLDAFNNKARISRLHITHNFFRDYGIELVSQLDNFQVANTTQKDNPIYYGNVFASGPFRMSGPFDNLYIKGDLTSNKGTLMNIPIRSGTNEAEKLSFIKFVDSHKPLTIQEDSLSRKLNLQGITMDFTLNLNPDAEIDIVFNPRNGEVIKAQGNGTLKLAIDTRGDFTMLGEYTISKGTYNFIFLNAINKKFDLQRGSTLTWSGSPTGAMMKINARHTLNSSLRPLVQSQDSTLLERPELRRKYPVTVLMDITGDLLKPNITFAIEIDRSYPAIIGADVQTFEARLQNDQQELNRQVFYLFVIRSLAPVSTVAGANDNLLASGSSSTISEMLSNQISSLLSTVDQNFSIDIDVNGWDANALNALQLRLSYSLLEGRLRIARSGGVTNAQNQATAASIAGDWLVEYMLSKDGIFRLRGFIRNNQVSLGTGFSTQQNITTSGFTVLHTQSFDKLSELIPKFKKPAFIPSLKLDLRPDSLVERDTSISGPKVNQGLRQNTEPQGANKPARGTTTKQQSLWQDLWDKKGLQRIPFMGPTAQPWSAWVAASR